MDNNIIILWKWLETKSVQHNIVFVIWIMLNEWKTHLARTWQKLIFLKLHLGYLQYSSCGLNKFLYTLCILYIVYEVFGVVWYRIKLWKMLIVLIASLKMTTADLFGFFTQFFYLLLLVERNFKKNAICIHLCHEELSEWERKCLFIL